MGVPAPSIYIDAPPDMVFGFWADPTNLTKLGGQLPYFEEAIEDVLVTPEGVGTTFRTVIRIKGVRLGSVTDRYVEVEKNRRIVDEPSSPNPRMVVTFAEEGSGTRVGMEAVVVSWPARVPLLREWWRNFHHRRFRTGLQSLKRLIEEPEAAS